MGGDIDVNATLRRGDFNQRHFDLSGTTVELRNVQVAGTGLDGMERPRGLQAGRIDAQSPFQVDATTDLDLSDARPLLALFAERTDYPRWTLSLLDSRSGAGDAALAPGPSGHRRAAGRERSPVGARAAGSAGAAQARRSLSALGLLGAGIELDGDQRQWHLAKAREWFDQQPFPAASARAAPRALQTEGPACIHCGLCV
jgi:hypothetical protein